MTVFIQKFDWTIVTIKICKNSTENLNCGFYENGVVPTILDFTCDLLFLYEFLHFTKIPQIY
ncbi:Uncharacterized protein GNX_0457 [Leptospira interrogans serovar Canicola]|nr:Uncharacterized protein GNX_0457 [Leptospira interrogans serovar Canicola]